MEEEENISTETLAELYLKGENIKEAHKIYRQLLKENPTSIRFKEKVRELGLSLRELRDDSSGRGESPIKPKRNIERAIGELKEWLNRIQQARKRSMEEGLGTKNEAGED
jgi:tetratricopeptide (TPR) repeat protein